MPQIARVVSDTDITIIRPVAMAVVRQMCEMVGIPHNVDILFPATEGVVKQAGSTMESADNTVWVAYKEVDPFDVETQEKEQEEEGIV